MRSKARSQDAGRINRAPEQLIRRPRQSYGHCPGDGEPRISQCRGHCGDGAQQDARAMPSVRYLLSLVIDQ
jgi:hypothetical protein